VLLNHDGNYVAGGPINRLYVGVYHRINFFGRVLMDRADYTNSRHCLSSAGR
jgi:hypothetical protein